MLLLFNWSMERSWPKPRDQHVTWENVGRGEAFVFQCLLFVSHFCLKRVEGRSIPNSANIVLFVLSCEQQALVAEFYSDRITNSDVV